MINQRIKGILLIFWFVIKDFYNEGDGVVDNNMKYSIQLAMLNQLLMLKLITAKEYNTIKIELMRKYNIMILNA